MVRISRTTSFIIFAPSPSQKNSAKNSNSKRSSFQKTQHSITRADFRLAVQRLTLSSIVILIAIFLIYSMSKFLMGHYRFLHHTIRKISKQYRSFHKKKKGFLLHPSTPISVRLSRAIQCLHPHHSTTDCAHARDTNSPWFYIETLPHHW